MKKRVLSGLAVMFFIFCAQAVAEEKGLVSYWSFDEGKGEAVYDKAGKNNGEIVNAEWVSGKVGKALKFSGDSCYVSIPCSKSLDISDAITIEAWVRHEGDDFKGWECILSKGDTAYRLHIFPGTFVFDFGANIGGGFNDLQATESPESGVWYHVAATYDGDKSCIYVNGKLSGSADWPGPIDTNEFDLYIGENSESAGRFFSGAIDEVKIYNRALSGVEIKDHYDKTK